ncbi:ABC transporter family substrate-binding protein [Corynebacterium pacaense]|uniref:ABC transporter family substrate-binding protein n=1 Tax=Corynebacterium pacaense TaxID=1816684 RepID=UPI0015C49884|nr:ABC transporter family substrate-binding protein [Corynebacterium pacaense]
MKHRLPHLVGPLLLAGALAACHANPGPAPVEEETSTTETQTSTRTTTAEAGEPEGTRNNISVGIDALRNGFNPHLVADDTSFVRDMAALVLPSAFVDDRPNTDLLESVEEVGGTIRYQIAQEAQWSDGTPITGADFSFLWQAMTTTPGVIDAAGYHAISAVRVTGGGKTVEVDLSEPVADWNQLFDNLLPSHLVAGSDFASAFYDTIPASAGRYMVRSIDRQRGVVVLSRNDRFWGANPASTELLTFQTAGSASRAGEFLRTGQSAFMNLTPTETLVDTFTLLPGTDLRVSDTDRTLELTLNAKVLDAGVRSTVLSLIDAPTTARLAAGRGAQLSVPERVDFGGVEKLPERPLRIAVDPADDQAVAAARAVVDQLAVHGIAAGTVSTDLASALEQALPDGEIDAVITWRRSAENPLSLASRYQCEQEVHSNLSVWCDPDTDTFLARVVAGAVDPVSARAWAGEFNATHALSLPLLRETRVEARTGGIVGASGDGAAWPGGIAGAANWRKNDNQQ